MEISRLVFVEQGVPKPLQREFAFGAGSQPAVLPAKGDVWSFNVKGDDVTRFHVESREFEETDTGTFECIVGIRLVPSISPR